MSAKYIMENSEESVRLEAQSQMKQFLFRDEVKHILLPENGRILDAGCGSGLASRYLNSQAPKLDVFGCDISEERLSFAKKTTPNTTFFNSNLTNITDHKLDFDLILNRYVAHHMDIETFRVVLGQFKQCLRKNGSVAIVDVDGVLQNIGTTNTWLIKKLSVISEYFGGDLNMARKIPRLLEEVGFKNISCHISTMNFQGVEKEDEIRQYELRIEYARELYINALGSKAEFSKFKTVFFEEIKKSTLFYNKFIIQGNT